MKLDLKRLRAERVACGLSQEDVAKKFGKTRSWYAKRENGFVSIYLINTDATYPCR